MTAPALDVPRVPRSVPDWHDDGACRQFDELDWVEAKPGSAEALACRMICAACPVKLECATGALERRERWGIWGGLDYHDRIAVAALFGYEQPGNVPDHGTDARYKKWHCRCPDCRAGHALYEFERRASAKRRAGLKVVTVEQSAPAAVVRLVRLDLAAYRRRTRRRTGRRR